MAELHNIHFRLRQFKQEKKSASGWKKIGAIIEIDDLANMYAIFPRTASGVHV
jgi:hypothetical protein